MDRFDINLPTDIPDFLTDPAWLGVAAWLAVVLATVALAQPISLGRWLWKRWRAPYVPRTQVQKDRENYALLLQQYESNLDFLENLIIIRAQHDAGPDPWTPELEQTFVETRDRIYRNLERRGKKEKDMGIFQKLDVLEGCLVSIGDTRKKRVELQARQAEIEGHPLFIKRPF